MEAKTITRQETVTETIYVASDGKEFARGADCMAHEFDIGYAAVQHIEHCDDLREWRPFGDDEYPIEHEYYWFRPKTEAEAEELNKTFGNSIKADEHIGEWICIEKGYDYDTWGVPLNEGVEYVKHILDKLGYDVVITERKQTE